MTAIKHFDPAESEAWEFFPPIQLVHQLIVSFFCRAKMNLGVPTSVLHTEKCLGYLNLEYEDGGYLHQGAQSIEESVCEAAQVAKPV